MDPKYCLHRSKISFSVMEKLICYYIQNKSTKEIFELLKHSYPTQSLAKNSIKHYIELFNKIAIDYYNQKLNTILLDGEIEIDESFLYKMKKTTAKHRPYRKSVWLFGMIQRETRQFIIVPVVSRDEKTLLPIILKHIKLGSTIYSDCFSTYLNNRVFPKESKLEKYGFHHQWINHQVEFVSSLFSHIHTNTIERLWLSIKTDFRKKNIKKSIVGSDCSILFSSDSGDGTTTLENWK